ncbi:MAG: M56 and MltD domain-containing protein [Oligoflexia bacterium]|nr:M56 and MltD domain-containing protein [Oligoflexia bacterium]
MIFSEIILSYIILNILLFLSYIGITLLSLLSKFEKISYRQNLSIQYGLIVSLFVFVALPFILPKQEFFEPVAKVWSSQANVNKQIVNGSDLIEAYVSFSSSKKAIPVKFDYLGNFFMFLFLATSLFLFLKISKEVHLLLKIKKNSYLYKKIGSLEIYVHDQIKVPFSFALVRTSNIILPQKFLEKKENFYISILHELQHHRQKDTLFIYFIYVAKIICWLNPFSHLWARSILEIQEFACDEALLGQKRVNSKNYANCLIDVAETALNQEKSPACATGLLFLIECNLIKRRIEKMLTIKKYNKARVLPVILGAAILSCFFTTTIIASNFVQDRRVSMLQATKMADKARSESSFPIVVNDLVLKQMNKYLGTPEGRKFMSDAILRMDSYKDLVEEKINKYHMPLEIMAIPLIESGYQNLPQRKNSKWTAAGLWQFIPSTARKFGMLVNSEVDERLNVEKETDAAMRYLLMNKLAFNDWLLSIMAYNMGENALESAIQKEKTRDAWKLIRAGNENDKNYLAKVMAAVLIMKNREVLE